MVDGSSSGSTELAARAAAHGVVVVLPRLPLNHNVYERASVLVIDLSLILSFDRGMHHREENRLEKNSC
jgi:hypothetical protein